jgi:hypothetical protein
VKVIGVVGASIVIVGADVYPLPEDVITIDPTAYVVDETASGTMTAYPVALDATWLVPEGGVGGAEKVTFGADVYLDPPFVILTLVTEPVTVTFAEAVVVCVGAGI